MCVWPSQRMLYDLAFWARACFNEHTYLSEDRNVIVEWCRCRFKQKIALFCSVWTRVDHKLTGHRMSGRHSVDCRDGDESKMFLLNQLVVMLSDATHQFIVLHVIELWLFGVSFVSDGSSGIPSHWTSDIKVNIAPLSYSSWIYFCCLCSPNEAMELWFMMNGNVSYLRPIVSIKLTKEYFSRATSFKWNTPANLFSSRSVFCADWIHEY